MTQICEPCTHQTDEWDEDLRLDFAWANANADRCDTCPFRWPWMKFVGFREDRTTLANARVLWLLLEQMLISIPTINRRIARAMPDDPEPKWWPINAPVPYRQEKVGGTIFDKVKHAFRVEDIAGNLTELRGLGNVMKGRCPLHNEQKGEAFAVYTDTQTWHCFGACNTGGDVISLVEACIERNIDWRMKP